MNSLLRFGCAGPSQAAVRPRGHSVAPRQKAGMRRQFHPGSAGALTLAVLILSVAWPAPADEGAAFNLHEIAAGVFVHQGVHVALDDPRRDDIANIGFIVGSQCTAVIDTGGSLRIGQALRAAVRAHTDQPICYIINTHVHYDHVLGNAAFLADAPKFVGHADLAGAIDASRGFFLQQFAAALGPDPTADRIIGPNVGVSAKTEIDLGDRIIELTAHPAAHTYTDLSVFDRKTGTLWLSDLLFIDRIPALDGSLSGWIRVIEELQSIPAARVVPGHGPPSAEWPRSADNEVAYLRDLRDEVRAGIAQGMLLEDALESVGRGEKDKWLLYEQHQGRNITKAYTELEWE